MADKSIPQLTALTTLASGDLFHVVRSNIDYKMDYDELMTAMLANLLYPFVQKSSNYTLLTTDETVECTSGTFTITLPTAVSATGKCYYIKNSGVGVITINTTSSQTIDGNASGTLTLNSMDAMLVQSNGSNWIIK